MVFDFSFKGWVKEQCDRCLVAIQLPISGEEQLLVKFGEPDEDGEDEKTPRGSQDRDLVEEHITLDLEPDEEAEDQEAVF